MVQKLKTQQDKDAEKQEKKELLKPDEFISTTGRAFQWLQDNSQTVLTGIAVLFGGAALVGALSWYQGSRNSEASLDLYRALKPYHRPVSAVSAPDATAEDEKPFATAKEKWTAARDALKPVADKHAGNGAGRLALLYLADTHAHLGEYADAITAYQKFIRDTSASDAMRWVGLQGLASAQEAKGDTKDAAKTFEEMVTLPGKQGRDIGYFNAGRILVGSADAADKTKGKDLLGKLSKEKDFETSPLKARAEELLAAN
ncbi:MAG: tetratricopeptide repeat protein [Deltaproteobacteria bacterium]|nr:tetratricopeptide repeat protein [Deltaproteobacteria bacterium]